MVSQTSPLPGTFRPGPVVLGSGRKTEAERSLPADARHVPLLSREELRHHHRRAIRLSAASRDPGLVHHQRRGQRQTGHARRLPRGRTERRLPPAGLDQDVVDVGATAEPECERRAGVPDRRVRRAGRGGAAGHGQRGEAQGDRDGGGMGGRAGGRLGDGGGGDPGLLAQPRPGGETRGGAGRGRGDGRGAGAAVDGGPESEGMGRWGGGVLGVSEVV